MTKTSGERSRKLRNMRSHPWATREGRRGEAQRGIGSTPNNDGRRPCQQQDRERRCPSTVRNQAVPPEDGTQASGEENWLGPGRRQQEYERISGNKEATTPALSSLVEIHCKEKCWNLR